MEARYFTFIYRLYQSICIHRKLEHEKDVYIDGTILGHIANRINSDVKIADEEHGIFCDAHKVGGFCTYWICKLRPVHLIEHKKAYKNLGKYAGFLNEQLAVLVSMSWINAENKKKLQRISSSERTPFDKRPSLSLSHLSVVMEDLMYNLYNCNLTPDSLAMIYYYMDITTANEAYLNAIR